MRVLVCGSRDWADHGVIYARMSELPGEHEIITVIHGGASGADKLADEAARYYGHTVEAFPADWKRHGGRAGPIRNLQMLDTRPDLVIVFQRNGSRGTQFTIDEAMRRGIPVEIHTA